MEDIAGATEYSGTAAANCRRATKDGRQILAIVDKAERVIMHHGFRGRHRITPSELGVVRTRNKLGFRLRNGGNRYGCQHPKGRGATVSLDKTARMYGTFNRYRANHEAPCFETTTVV